VASAPVDAELTGPWFSPDHRSLFLSVQHPGASGRDNFKKPTSTWPDGTGQHPKPAVICLQGPLFAKIIG
jgi:secreted PhoX family phosphatase